MNCQKLLQHWLHWSQDQHRHWIFWLPSRNVGSHYMDRKLIKARQCRNPHWNEFWNHFVKWISRKNHISGLDLSGNFFREIIFTDLLLLIFMNLPKIFFLHQRWELDFSFSKKSWNTRPWSGKSVFDFDFQNVRGKTHESELLKLGAVGSRLHKKSRSETEFWT